MDDDQQQQHLLMCRSAGIVCAIAAALPHIYLDGPSPRTVVLPQETLEIDMQGRMDIAGDGSFAFIDLGQVERELEYADAVKQLGIQLGTIGWFVQVCCNVRSQHMHLVGRLVAPKNSLGASSVASDPAGGSNTRLELQLVRPWLLTYQSFQEAENDWPESRPETCFQSVLAALKVAYMCRELSWGLLHIILVSPFVNNATSSCVFMKQNYFDMSSCIEQVVTQKRCVS